jgi:hypothetical protein
MHFDSLAGLIAFFERALGDARAEESPGADQWEINCGDEAVGNARNRGGI